MLLSIIIVLCINKLIVQKEYFSYIHNHLHSNHNNEIKIKIIDTLLNDNHVVQNSQNNPSSSSSSSSSPNSNMNLTTQVTKGQNSNSLKNWKQKLLNIKYKYNAKLVNYKKVKYNNAIPITTSIN